MSVVQIPEFCAAEMGAGIVQFSRAASPKEAGGSPERRATHPGMGCAPREGPERGTCARKSVSIPVVFSKILLALAWVFLGD